MSGDVCGGRDGGCSWHRVGGAGMLLSTHSVQDEKNRDDPPRDDPAPVCEGQTPSWFELNMQHGQGPCSKLVPCGCDSEDIGTHLHMEGMVRMRSKL